MNDDLGHLLGSLILGRSVAALATLHEGAPFASMIPYAVHMDDSQDRLRFVTHVSRLSAHTRDMLASSAVCLLITAPEQAGFPPQALPRVSLPATASFVDPAATDHEALKAAYLGRFPHAADYFQLGDFSIVTLAPTSARFIAGFARAVSLSVPQLCQAVRGAASQDVSGA